MTPLLRRGLSLDRLASFVAVMEAGGLARAAPGDPVRQSQLSRQVKELELAFGRELLTRTPRGLEPTAAGVALASAVRAFSRELVDVDGASSGPGRVTLGAGDSVLQWLVLPRLAKLGLTGLELEVLALGAEGTVSALQEQRIDLGVLRANEASGDFKSVRLGLVEYAIFEAERDLPLAVPTSERGLSEALEKLEQQREVGLRCETFPQIARAVTAGTHAGVLPVFAHAALGNGIRRVTTPQLARAASPLALVWRSRTLERRTELRELRHKLEQVIRAALRV
ncbi:MAG: LysR family transcriptional regulator [Archangium sp.]